ncbi:MAG: polysaccharide deacetylase family protein [Actinomycetes bacterium]
MAADGSTSASDSARSLPSAEPRRGAGTTATRWAGSPAASLPTGPRLNAPSSSRSGSAASTPPRPSWALLGRRYTRNHQGLDRLRPAQVAAEVDCTNRLLARLAGRPVRLLRPPDGAYDKTVVDLLATRRLQLILWTVDSRDWARPGVRRILATVARELRPGRSSCCTTAAATAPRPSPRCPRCCGSCTPAATGPSPCHQCSGAGQTVRPVGGQAGPAAGAAGGECGAVSERSQQ